MASSARGRNGIWWRHWIRSVGGNVYCEVAGGLAADLVGVGCLAGGERVVRRHAEDTGMAGDNLWVATRRAVPFFMLAALAICGAGLFFGDVAAMPAHLIEPGGFYGYYLLFAC